MGRHPRAEQAAAQMVALDVLRHHRVGDRLLAADAGLAAGVRATPRAGSATASARWWLSSSKQAKAAKAEFRAEDRRERSCRDQCDPELLQLRAGRRRGRVRRQLRALSRPRRARRLRLSEPARRFLAVGRLARRHPSDHPARHSGRRSQDAQPGAQMPAFGTIGSARREPQIDDVAEYVLSLSGRADDEAGGASGAPRSSPTTARPVTARKARATRRSARPILTDELWLYGGDKATIAEHASAAAAAG